MRPEGVQRLPGGGSPAGEAAAPRSTRGWLQETEQRLEGLLPSGARRPLETEDLTDADGRPVDVFAYFGLRRQSLQSLVWNFNGLRCTAQSAAREYCIDQPATPWPGFEDVWIPIGDKGLSLAGRLGYARDGDRIKQADCIVIMPGLFGDNGVKRSQDLAVFLRDAGFHVLSLELRAHGQTEARYPNFRFLFGIAETEDLMYVSDWLEQLPNIERTGLIGFCFSSNIALLAAWFDGRPADDACIHPVLDELLIRPTERRRFGAGIIAFSPIIDWEYLVGELDRPQSSFTAPVYAAIQDTVRDRAARKHYAVRDGNLRDLIEEEYRAHWVVLPNGSVDGYPFIRLVGDDVRSSGNKLNSARVPVLIVHGCDDPLAPAQDVANLVAVVDNPLVAAIILPGGGHVGFAPYAKEYYYSLVANFFDPVSGAAGRGE